MTITDRPPSYDELRARLRPGDPPYPLDSLQARLQETGERIARLRVEVDQELARRFGQAQ